MVWYGIVLFGGSEKGQFVGDETRIETWRWIELLQMLEVTTNGSQNLRSSN